MRPRSEKPPAERSRPRSEASCVTYSSMRATAAACCYACAALNLPHKKVKKQAAEWCTETDGQTLRSFFLRDNHHLLLA